MDNLIKPLVALLLVAAAVGMLARRFRLPYTLALVVAGLGLGALHLQAFAGMHLTPDLLLTLLLPPLLFEASFHLDGARLRREAWVTFALAGPGVFVSTALTAALTWAGFHALAMPGLDVGAAFLFAAIVAATDPVSVLALFKALRVEPRLSLLVEAESLLNDGVAVVAYMIVGTVLGVQVGHAMPTLATPADIVLYGVGTLMWMTGVGLAAGALVGLAGSAVTRAIDDHLVEVAISAIVAWGAFIAADSVHASGVLACVAAGVVHGNLGGRHGMSPRTRVAVIDFWEFLAFFANTLVFLLLGLELDVTSLWTAAVPITLAWLAVLVARSAVVGLGALVSRRGEPIPSRWLPVLVWGGLRGSLSMVLVIGLPTDYAARPLLVTLVFGVTAATLLVQGLSMEALLRRTGVLGDRATTTVERARAGRLVAARALAEIRRLEEGGQLGPKAAATLRSEYDRRRDEADTGPAIDALDLVEARRHLFAVERDALHEAAQEGLVSEASMAHLFDELTARRGPDGHDA